MASMRMTTLGGLALLLAWSCGGGSDQVAGNDHHGSGGSSGSGASGGGDGSAASGGSSGSGADGGISLDGPTTQIESLAVDPPTATIDVSNGASTPVQFDAIATYKGGATAKVTASWTFDRVDLASISPAGSLQAQNIKGGKGTVTASASGMTATAAVEVHLHLSDNPAGLSSGDQGKFNSPDTNPSGTLLYPYDNTVFARGLLPPELMWSGGAAGDTYKITLVDAYVDVTTYVSADPPSRWVVPKASWTALTESADGSSPVAVTVSRLDAGGTAHLAMHESWKIAPGSLRGTIFYWEVNQGQIVKINPGADAPVPAFDPGLYTDIGTPPPSSGYSGQSPPWDSAGSGHRCVACHTVSKDGSKMVALFSACGTAGVCARPWGSIDTASETISSMSEYVPGDAIYSALSPDGSKLVHDTVGFHMALKDPVTTQPIASALDSLTQVASPQFSPDGKLMAFVGNAVGAYPIEFTQSDLEVFDVDFGVAPYFSNQRMVTPGNGSAISFPSFTPDSKWIAYQRGDYSRASYGSAAPLATGHNDLYVADVAKQVGEIRLGLANGDGVLTAKDQQRNYNPRVNPIAVGGYFWVVFVSPRDYGNRMQSTSDSTNENHKQLWVTAIDATPTPGVDPSHPAFWLPGQDQTSINMDAYWALEPCKQDGNSCNEGYECCSGFCRDQGNGTFACIPPPTNQCAQIGEACKTAADCCTSTKKIDCIGGFCAYPGPA